MKASIAIPFLPSAIPAWAAARLAVVALLCTITALAHAGEAGMNASATLRARYTVLQDQLDRNQFRQPLHLNSNEAPGGVKGDIHALVNYPFATVRTALNSPEHWCDILMLHLNTKYCRAATVNGADVINVSIGKKHDQPLDQAYRVVFAWRVAAQGPDYLQITLTADSGPLSTSNYSIVLEAIPLDGDRTFIHLSYAYDYGLAGRLAMQAYLGTIGRDKVGFTIAGNEANGSPRHIGGLRGVVERNTMRYYLAIEAYLGALSAPPRARLEKRIQDWFAASERYPRQLHEMERDEYLEMKRREYQRQQRGAPAVLPG
jgi:hypothetical protein